MIYEILDAQGNVENTIVADEQFMQDNYPDGNYRLVPDAPIQEPAQPWEWLIDHGPFTDRLGAAATFAIDTSPDPAFVAIRSDFARRKWIDLKDARVVATVNYLAGEPMPVFGILAEPLLTREYADAVLNTPVADLDNMATRKMYF